MRDLGAFGAHLKTGSTTVCHCFRLRRHDGVVMGFTDHDEPVRFDGVTFEAAAGISASEVKTDLGLAADTSDFAGALDSLAITEQDIAAGLYDNAEITLYRVNWSDPAQRAVIRTGHLGEITRADGAFTAELRGIAHQWQETQGRLFQTTCDAELGDARCKVDLGPFTGSGAIIATDGFLSLTASGLGAFERNVFSRGRLVMTSGEASGNRLQVASHTLSAGAVVLTLFERSIEALAPGDTFTIVAGCDHTPDTCRKRFANMANYRGFPHIPGSDFVMRYPVAGRPTDGSSTYSRTG